MTKKRQMNSLSIIEDPRQIISIFSGSTFWKVGLDDVAQIMPYQETGPMAYVTWFALLDKEGNVLYRINSNDITGIKYAVQ